MGDLDRLLALEGDTPTRVTNVRAYRGAGADLRRLYDLHDDPVIAPSPAVTSPDEAPDDDAVAPASHDSPPGPSRQGGAGRHPVRIRDVKVPAVRTPTTDWSPMKVVGWFGPSIIVSSDGSAPFGDAGFQKITEVSSSFSKVLTSGGTQVAVVGRTVHAAENSGPWALHWVISGDFEMIPLSTSDSRVKGHLAFKLHGPVIITLADLRFDGTPGNLMSRSDYEARLHLSNTSSAPTYSK